MRVETRTRDNSLKRVRTRRTPPTTPPRKEARIQGRDYKETRDTSLEERTAQNITNTTRMKEEI